MKKREILIENLMILTHEILHETSFVRRENLLHVSRKNDKSLLPLENQFQDLQQEAFKGAYQENKAKNLLCGVRQCAALSHRKRS